MKQKKKQPEKVYTAKIILNFHRKIEVLSYKKKMKFQYCGIKEKER